MKAITTNPLRRSLVLGAAALLPLAACADEPVAANSDAALLSRNGPAPTFYGEAIALGDGTARTYVVLGAGGPVELGVALSEGAFDNLPEGHDHGHGPMSEFILSLPTQAAVTPYKFVELNWTPLGHVGGPYALPHFDFHFYTISIAERNAIDPTDPEYAQKAGNLPPTEQTPANYVAMSTLTGAPPEEVAAPFMGMHWVDITSPELNGGIFNTTFIYGSWNGKFIFGEPMVTTALLQSKPNLTLPVPVPQRVSTPGAYPSAYRIYWNEQTQEYRVSLTDFARRN